MLYVFGIESQYTKIMDRIPIHWESIDFFLVVECDRSPERPGSYNVAICKNVANMDQYSLRVVYMAALPIFGINNEARPLAGLRYIRIE